MKTTAAPKSTDKGFTIRLTPVKRANFLPVSVQISLAAQAKRHDKRKSRAKAKRQWRKGM